MRVRAAVVESTDVLKIQELDLGEPRANEVRVKLVATGICHTDLSMLHGNLPVPTPFVAGHEGAGVVEVVGPGVTHVVPGDHVICSIVQRCGLCFACVRGLNPCEQSAGVAFSGTMLDGSHRLHRGDEVINHVFCQSSFAESTIIPGYSAVKINPAVPLDKVAALGCGVGTGLGATINRADIRPGQSVLVMGAGGVGLAAVLGARFAGAAQIIAVDVSGPKLKRATELGADHVINSKETDLGEAVAELSGGRGVDVSIDCVGIAGSEGAPGTLEQCVASIHGGGTAVAVGIMHVANTATIDVLGLLTEKTITGSWAGSISPHKDLPYWVDMYAAGRLDIGALVDRTGSLDEVEVMLTELDQGLVTKAVIRY